MVKVGKLNRAEVSNAEYAPPGKSYYLMDGSLPGFGLRVHSRRKSYVVRFRQRTHLLGPAEVLPIETARERAKALLSRLWAGDDPKAASATVTVSDLCDRYTAEHGASRKAANTLRGDEQLWRTHILPELAKIRLIDLNRDRLAAWHAARAGTPSAANRALALLRAAINVAATWGWVPDGFNPASKIAQYPEYPAERAFTSAEIRALGAAMLEARRFRTIKPDILDATTMLALTGARPGEIGGLLWEFVDFDARAIRLPRAKGDRPGRARGRTVWLPSAAVNILSTLRPPDTASGPVFPKLAGNAGRQRLHSGTRRLCRLAGIEPAPPKTWRHTFLSHAAKAGVDLGLSADLAGHATVEMTYSTYRHSDDADQREASEKLGSHLAGLLLNKEPSAPGGANKA